MATPAPPPLVAKQFVYTEPADYTPDGLSALQIQQLNGELANLHFPFYVVIYKDTPELDSDDRGYARTNGFQGDEKTQRIEVTTSRLMERWAANEATYNPGTTSVFVMGFNPRKFAWHPALNWKNNLGLDQRAQDPYTQEFLRAAKTKPVDYGRAIANLARKLDDFAFDQTDPARIAQRAEIQRQENEARRLQAAQGALDTKILHLAELLKDPEYLPADTDSYKGTLAKAKGVRATNEPNLMLAEAETMKGTVAVLDKYVTEAKSAARAAFHLLAVKWATGFLLVFTLAALMLRRRRDQKRLIAEYQDEFSKWATMVKNARNRWFELYFKRDDIIGLGKVTGKTAALRATTTKAVDDILVRIEAMGGNLKSIATLFGKGHYLNFRPLKQALASLDAPFTFDTGVINEADLFGGETVTMIVNPRMFADETKALFAASIEGWNRLKKAAQERHGAVEEDFPHSNIDQMFVDAQEHKLPERWFSEHPLFGDDAADAHFYQGLAAIRDTDPLAYVEKLEELRRAESHLMLKMRALVTVRERVTTARVETAFCPAIEKTVVSPDDDPIVTIAQARQAEDKLEGLFVTATSTDEVQSQCDTVVTLYRKCTQQGAELKSAILGCRNALEKAKAVGKEAEVALNGATARVGGARSLFKRLAPAEGDLQTARSFIEKGTRKVQDALKAIEATRHLAARRLADEAVNAFTQAIQASNAAMSHVSNLEKERVTFLERAGGLSQVRNGFARKMKELGNHARPLAAVNVQMPESGPADFAILIGTLNAQESSWRAECRRSEEAYEAEQAAIRRRRQEEEDRRRRQEEEDRRARSSYYSSSSSSSSSSGGGFGGSSGDSGGGGFGGSSGDF